ncbi:MAG: molybdopterin-dependent oxidoreductase [Chloroflexota bacterium]
MEQRNSGALKRLPVGAATGAAAAVCMLGAQAVLRLATGVISLPELIGEAMFGQMPAALFSAILDLMQRTAKPTLWAGVLLGQIVVGALLGMWFTRRGGGWPSALQVAVLAWLATGSFVLPVLGVGLFGSGTKAGAVVVGSQLLMCCLVYGTALAVLNRLTNPAGAQSGRRAALGQIAAAGAALIGVGVAWRWLMAERAPESIVTPGAAPPPAPQTAVSIGPRRPPSVDAPAVPLSVLPNAAAAAPFDQRGLGPEVMTAADFYTVSKNFLDPTVESGSWTLTIDGLVERPLKLSLADLARFKSHSDYYTLQCISNLIGGDQWGNAHWSGVRLVTALAEAGLKPGVRKLIFHAADDYTDSVTLDTALRADALLAYEMNGEPLTREHGAPARLLIPGIYGMKNVKWVTRIEAVNFDYKGYWMQRGWSDLAAYQTASRIDTPRTRQNVPPGEVTFSGVAFAGHRGIDRVEVSVDGGTSWQDATVKPPLSSNAWNLWALSTRIEAPGSYTVKVRATDGDGQVQTDLAHEPLPSGATGYHTIIIRVG